MSRYIRCLDDKTISLIDWIHHSYITCAETKTIYYVKYLSWDDFLELCVTNQYQSGVSYQIRVIIKAHTNPLQNINWHDDIQSYELYYKCAENRILLLFQWS